MTQRKTEPVADAALAAGVEDLGHRVEALHQTVRDNVRLRRVRWLIAAAVAAGLWANVGFMWRQTNRTNQLLHSAAGTGRENHELLVTVKNATSPETAKAAAAAQSQVVDHIIACVDNFVDHELHPVSTLRPDCPTP